MRSMKTVLVVLIIALLHISPFTILPAIAALDPIFQTSLPEYEDDLLQLLDDQPEESAANLWESLHYRGRQPHLRARISDVTEQDYAAHLLRVSGIVDQYTYGALIQRDVAEPDIIDLWRVAVETDISGARIILGDFRVDQQLGWTVASSPVWASATDAMSPLRRPHDSIRMNLSSEEGWGWRGLALTKPITENDLNLRLDLWGGYSDFDARQDNDLTFSPLATQGDHTPDRDDYLETVTAYHTGAYLESELPLTLGEMSIIGALTRFEKNLSPDIDNARFRFAEDSFSAVGIGYQWTDPSSKRYLQSEVTIQNDRAWGGSVVATNAVGDHARVIANAWRATQSFSTFHARPSLAYGSDPAGITGTLLAGIFDLPLGIISSGGALDWTETDPVHHQSELRRSVFVRLTTDQVRNVIADISLRYRSDQFVGNLTDDSFFARLLLRRDLPTHRIDLRMDAALNNSGSATAITLGAQQPITRFFHYHLTLSVVKESGAGAVITLVEPTGPGLFPIRRVSSEMVSGACRVDLIPLKQIKIWASGRVDHQLNEGLEDSNPTRFILSLGLEWRDFLSW